jgi:hypothetical protein
VKNGILVGCAPGLVVLCCTVLLLGGCNRDALDEPGVVATVNGAPIRTTDLEARQDLRRLGTPVVDNPSVERLRAEYGSILADMIVARLVRQELARLHLSVTAAELAAAERDVMADYPDGAFDRMMLEEHIDPERWRQALGDRLALDKFTREVLRQNVRVGVSEAASYYKEHINAFTKPARLRLAILGGKDAETLKAALAAYRKTNQLASLDGMPGLTIQEVNLPVKNLSPAWREALKPLKPGEASAVLAGSKESTALILLARQPETVLDPAKAYAQVEALLLEDKLEKAFAAWLAEALAGAKIAVSRQLVATSTASAAPAGSKTEAERGQAGNPEGNNLVEPNLKSRDAKRDAQEPAPAIVAEATRQPEKKDAPAPSPKDTQTPSPDATAGDASPPAQEAPSDKAATAATPPSPPVVSEAAPIEASGDGKAIEAAVASREPEPAKAAAPEAVPASPPVASPPPVATPPQAPAGPASPESSGKDGAGEVEFAAVKASWILYTVDDGQEDRVYLKPGKPYRIVYTRKLSVRLGSPSEIKYRAGGKEISVEVGKKESRVLEFP